MLLVAAFVDAGETPYVLVEGQGEAAANALGRQLAPAVRANVKWLIDEYAGKALKLSREQLATRRDALKRTWTKEFVAEIEGLSKGAQVDQAEVELANAVPLALDGEGVVLFSTRAVGGKVLHTHSISIPKGLDSKPSLAVVVRTSNAGATMTVALPGLVGSLAGINDQGVSISALPIQASDKPGLSASWVTAQALEQSAKLDNAVGRLENQARSSTGWFLVADGKNPDARAVEASPDQTSVFGPKDSAERVAPFSPLDKVVRRSGALVDPKWSIKPTESAAQRYAALTAFSNIAAGTTVAETLQFLRKQQSGRAVLYDVLLSPSDQEIWVSTDGAAGEAAFVRRHLPSILKKEPAERWERRETKEKPLDPAQERLLTGTTQPKDRGADTEVPKLFRMTSEAFRYELEPEKIVGGIARSKLRFPSPVKTPHEENNTVHTEFFHPRGDGPFPCVITLHIAGGDFELSRFTSNALAQQGIASVFVKMPYYGERRPPNKRIRMLEPDVDVASEAMRQVVLDLRRLCDWIESRPELDPTKIGVLGISLGSITGALSSAIEPRISHACLIMGGAKLEEVVWASVEGEARSYRQLWEKSGGTKESLGKLMAPFDPYTYRDRLAHRIVFMINATEDTSIPRVATKALWEATGGQEIVWYPCGHYTMVKYLGPALQRSVQFFKHWPTGPKQGAFDPKI